MGKKLFLIVAVALLMGAGQAQAFSERFSWASALPVVCSGCVRRTSSPALVKGSTMEVYRIPSGGGSIVYRTQFPSEATGGQIRVRINFFDEAGSPTGYVCTRVCAKVVKPGQDLDNNELVPTASTCSNVGVVSQDAVTSQYGLVQNDPTWAMTPYDATSPTPIACSGTACNNGILLLQLDRAPSDGIGCSNTDNIEFNMGEIEYQ